MFGSLNGKLTTSLVRLKNTKLNCNSMISRSEKFIKLDEDTNCRRSPDAAKILVSVKKRSCMPSVSTAWFKGKEITIAIVEEDERFVPLTSEVVNGVTKKVGLRKSQKRLESRTIKRWVRHQRFSKILKLLEGTTQLNSRLL